LKEELEVAMQAATAASKIILSYYNNVPVERKADESPVTRADREAEELIRKALLDAYPRDGFLGEEFGEVDGKSGRRWVVDPIDGTKSFVYGVPLFSTLIGLEMRGEPALGIAYFPALDEAYVAAKGEGAFMNGEPIRVNDIGEMSDALLLSGSIGNLERHGHVMPYLNLVRECYAARTWCDAYGYCMVARGSASIMLDASVSVWDTCAVSVIVREAGGTFTDLNGNETHLGGSAIATNGRLHEAVLALWN
jgi:histidinol phosphatase-like enzyme (inositol monophosphatase family)